MAISVKRAYNASIPFRSIKPILVMRKSLALLLLTLFVGILPLQAYAQTCAMHCALMQADMDHAAGDSASHNDESPCAQSTICQLAQCLQFSVIPAIGTNAEAVVTGTFSPPHFVAEHLPNRKLSPLDRPPILS